MRKIQKNSVEITRSFISECTTQVWEQDLDDDDDTQNLSKRIKRGTNFNLSEDINKDQKEDQIRTNVISLVQKNKNCQV